MEDIAPPSTFTPGQQNYHGLIPVMSSADLEAKTTHEAGRTQQVPVIMGLASHTRKRWELMRDYKRQSIEERLRDCTRSRAMEYSPEKLADIRAQGGSEIYMGIVSSKCRTATAWLRDALLGSGSDKPWSIAPTPMPEVPPEFVDDLRQIMEQTLQQHYAQGGERVTEMELRALAADMKDTAMRQLKHEATKRVDRMELKMEDQLQEGGMTKAMYAFTNDIATFPYAVMKGPVVRKRKLMKWSRESGDLEIQETLRDEWERVDPYRFYWAPWGDEVQAMPCIEVHHLTREDVQDMLGVEGYDEPSVRSILENFGTGGLTWLDDGMDADHEISGKDYDDAGEDLVAAIQLWDSIQGKYLRDWGMSDKEIPDPHMSYPCEVWMVNNTVIRAVLNYDPLGRKPYYVTSFEKVPGRLDGNGVADLTLDAQHMCNAAARSLANNMGIASGPQVGVNVSRLPPGEDITQMSPWKIWQFRQSEYGDASPPLQFFQPTSNASELMAVYDRYMGIADEMSGIPRYMTGQHVPGAGRTSSGLSMLMSNAGKSIKQVISNIDHDVLAPMLQRQYQRNLRYSNDMDMIGDVTIVARGAMALVVKETEAVRKADFLRLVLESDIAQRIVGLPGTAELMRDTAKDLGPNVDRLVPSREEVERLQAQQQAEAEQLQAQEQAMLQEDGSKQGGRASNAASPRPNGK